MTPEKRLYTKLKEVARLKHPNYPENLTLPGKVYRLNTANGLTQAVIEWVRAHGYQAERVSTTGRLIDRSEIVTDVVGFKRRIGSNEWIPGTGTKGSADIHATIPLKHSNGFGVSVKIEIKVGKDRLSPAQKKYGEQMELAGGVYLVVKELNDLFQWWDENVI
jgi:hypothetical protein